MKNQAGLTLFETMVVLAIVGFVLASTISVNQLIERSTSKTLVREMQEVKHMLYAYRERYGAIPGDDTSAAKKITGATSADEDLGGNALIDGTEAWNMRSVTGISNKRENELFWQHVRKAGLAKEEQYNLAHNAVGGILGITSNDKIPTRPAGVPGLYNVCSSRISGTLARAMDEEVDDGDAKTGVMWAAMETEGVSVNTPTAPTPYVNEKRYTVCTAF